ncbi:hypothetical protein FRX31_005074 [Thalictrum thalictroides]|uniref:Uncharacterized protein n=1 Tax=Thalictrum thalictroides TaxID=46969 RepID=A0A7J6X6R0_THATH|nr:hypothetical protein FRX31_005074 [Thalictrum thalictroides]
MVFLGWTFNQCSKIAIHGSVKEVEVEVQQVKEGISSPPTESQVQNLGGDKNQSYAQVMGGNASDDKRVNFIETIKDDQPQVINVADLPSPSLKGYIEYRVAFSK